MGKKSLGQYINISLQCVVTVLYAENYLPTLLTPQNEATCCSAGKCLKENTVPYMVTA